MPRYWGIRVGIGGESDRYADLARERGLVTIGWEEMGDLGWLRDAAEPKPAHHELLERCRTTYGATSAQLAMGATQLWRFVREIQPGDAVLLPQLLVLLDGLEARGQVFVLATTNRPDDIDPALRRPGRFDQTVWMGLPDEHGRAKIFGHYLRGLELAVGLEPERLAAELAAAAPGLTGADIAFTCQRAALLCIKEAVKGASDINAIAVAQEHFHAALAPLSAPRTAKKAHDGPRLAAAC